ncbi:MAG: IclR family transcriptional regulator [Comamonadaceae bacterium]|nr:MAG: IclR family transcriptional regulator [Comamonadaceae bacterium]
MKPDPKKAASDDEKTEVSALARGLALLQVIAGTGPMTVKDLATETGIPKATVSRMVATLLTAGYLRQEEGSTLCRLGPAFLAAGNAYLGDIDLRVMLRPHMLNVANLSGAKVNVGVRSGLEIVVVDSIRPRSAVILSYMEVGARMDLATSAAGRAYIASLEEEARQEVLEELRASGASAWRSTAARMKHAVAEFHELGYCTSFGEWHSEINAIGVVVRGPAGERFSVSCGGPTYKLTPEFLRQQVAPALLRAVNDWT